jgi:hypothetical protein
MSAAIATNDSGDAEDRADPPIPATPREERCGDADQWPDDGDRGETGQHGGPDVDVDVRRTLRTVGRPPLPVAEARAGTPWRCSRQATTSRKRPPSTARCSCASKSACRGLSLSVPRATWTSATHPAVTARSHRKQPATSSSSGRVKTKNSDVLAVDRVDDSERLTMTPEEVGLPVTCGRRGEEAADGRETATRARTPLRRRTTQVVRHPMASVGPQEAADQARDEAPELDLRHHDPPEDVRLAQLVEPEGIREGPRCRIRSRIGRPSTGRRRWRGREDTQHEGPRSAVRPAGRLLTPGAGSHRHLATGFRLGFRGWQWRHDRSGRAGERTRARRRPSRRPYSERNSSSPSWLTFQTNRLPHGMVAPPRSSPLRSNVRTVWGSFRGRRPPRRR